jgi:hypothetical protein
MEVAGLPTRARASLLNLAAVAATQAAVAEVALAAAHQSTAMLLLLSLGEVVAQRVPMPLVAQAVVPFIFFLVRI